MKIGERIKQRRLFLNMSQEELAIKLGYKSRSSINKIELDGQDLPSDKIMAIANALNTSPAYIMGWVQDSDIEMLDEFHALNEAQRLAVLAVMHSFTNQNNEQAKKDEENSVSSKRA